MPTTDKRLQRGLATRTQLVRSALGLIASDGLAGVTAGALAEAAGVSKATIFHHFDRLQDVSYEALDMLVSDMMPATPSADPSATRYLVRLGTESLQAIDDSPGLVAAAQAFMIAGAHDAELRQRMARVSRSAREQVTADLLRLAPDTPPDAATEIADVAIASLDGIGLHLMLTGERDAFEQAWRHQALRLAEGLVERRHTDRGAMQ